MPARIARVICFCGLLIGFGWQSYAQLSEKIRAQIAANLPKFDPAAAKPTPESPVGTPAPLSDDPLIQLPDFPVKEKRMSATDPDQWLGRHALERKAMSDYSDSMTDLEWALNCWYIPFITASPQARANAAYASKKIREERKRLESLIKISVPMDSAEDTKLLGDLDFSRHPGN